MLVGLITTVVAVALLLFTPSRLWGLATLALGLAVVSLSLREMSRKVRRSRYHIQPWRRRDTILAVISVSLLIAIVVAKLIQPSLFTFYPYPRLTAPPFNPLVGIAIVALAAPKIRDFGF
jgi:energy-coupling factor transport system permease protein